jgi:hypothetical protein
VRWHQLVSLFGRRLTFSSFPDRSVGFDMLMIDVGTCATDALDPLLPLPIRFRYPR